MGDANGSIVIVEDADSPAVWYTGNWTTSTSTQFHGGSQHISSDPGAQVYFAFTGERFSYFATSGPQHGNCVVEVDGNVVQPQLSTYSTAFHTSKAVYTQDVEPGSHTVVITNVNGQASIDYFSYRQISLEQPNSGDIAVSNSSILYMPDAAWFIEANGYTETKQQGASFSFRFEGEYMWFNWDRNYDHGVFTVTVDNTAPAYFSGYSHDHTNMLLMYSRALSPGPHSVTFTNMEDGSRRLGVASLIYRPIASPTSNSRFGTSRSSLSTETTTPTLSSPPVLTLVSSSTSTPPVEPQSASHSSTSEPSQVLSPGPSVQRDPSSPSAVAGAVGGAAALVIVISIVAVVAIFRIKQKRHRRARSDGSELTIEDNNTAISPLSFAVRSTSPSDTSLPSYSEPQEYAQETYASTAHLVPGSSNPTYASQNTTLRRSMKILHFKQ